MCVAEVCVCACVCDPESNLKKLHSGSLSYITPQGSPQLCPHGRYVQVFTYFSDLSFLSAQHKTGILYRAHAHAHVCDVLSKIQTMHNPPTPTHPPAHIHPCTYPSPLPLSCLEMLGSLW